MQTLTLTVQDNILDKVLDFLKDFSQSEVTIIQDPSMQGDIFEQTAGILNHQVQDPVAWQRDIRSKDWE